MGVGVGGRKTTPHSSGVGLCRFHAAEVSVTQHSFDFADMRRAAVTLNGSEASEVHAVTQTPVALCLTSFIHLASANTIVTIELFFCSLNSSWFVRDLLRFGQDSQKCKGLFEVSQFYLL